MQSENRQKYLQEYRLKNRAKLNEQKRLIYQKDHDRCLRNSRVNRWNGQGINITYAGYQELLEKQEHKCAICKRHESELIRALAVDHDHATGKIRGLLCMNCNWLVVRVVEKHSPLIPRALEYLGEIK